MLHNSVDMRRNSQASSLSCTELMASSWQSVHTRPTRRFTAVLQVLTSELGYDGRLSDVWSAGVVLYILLTGCRSSSTYTTAWDLSCPLRHAATVQCELPALQKPCERAVSQSMMQLSAEYRWRLRLAICAAGWPRGIPAETTRCFPFLETAEENDDPVAKMRAMFPRIVQGAFLPIHSSVRIRCRRRSVAASGTLCARSPRPPLPSREFALLPAPPLSSVSEH